MQMQSLFRLDLLRSINKTLEVGSNKLLGDQLAEWS